jgi:Tfp pilus assembly protein PilN
MPRVNLLPPEIAAEAKLKRLKMLLGLVVLGAMVVAVLVYLMVSSQVGGAEDQLAEAKVAGAGLQAEVDSYAEVPLVTDQLVTAEANLTTAMEPEIRWSFYLNDLSLTIPQTSRLSAMQAINNAAVAQLAGSTAVTATGAPVTPLGATTMGSITFSSKSTDFDAVAAWLQSLARTKGYLEPSVQSVTKAESTSTVGTFYDVESNTQLSSEAASGRYLQIANGE